MKFTKNTSLKFLFCLQFCVALAHSASCLDGFMLFGADQASLGKDNETSGGKIGTNGNLTLGNDSKQKGSIRAGGNIVVGSESVVTGDASAGGTITVNNEGLITGKKSPNTRTTNCSIPLETILTGTQDVAIVASATQTVQPGTYRNVSTSNLSILKLVAGTYYFQSLFLFSSSKINFNTTAGPIRIYIKNSFQLMRDNHFEFTGSYAPEKVKFYYDNSAALNFGINFEFQGNIFAPNAEVHFLKDTKLFGACYAKRVTIDNDVKITCKPFVTGSGTTTVKIKSPVTGILTKLSTIPVSWTINEVTQTTQTTENLLIEGANKIKRCSGSICDSVNVNRDQTAPLIQITSPTSGTVTTATSIPVAWKIDGVTQTTSTSENLVLGVNTITRTATDAAGNLGSASVQVTRYALNHIPVAHGEGYSLKAGDSLKVLAPGILVNDSDSDGDPLKAVLINNVKHGTFAFNSNGSFSYKPTLGFSGLDSLGYRVTDNKDTAALVWTVLTVNHTPLNLVIVSPTDGYLTKVNSVTVNYTLNGSARNKVFALVEGANTVSVDTVDDLGHTVSASVNVTLDDISPVVKITSPLSGTTTTLTSILVIWLVDGIDQSVQTTENLVMGVNSITRTSTDAAGNVGTASITLTRVKPNSIPVGVNDGYSVNAGDSIKVAAPGVLSNDTDDDSDPLTVLLASGFKQGTYTLYASGALSYKPTLGFYGKDTLTYKVTDGKDTSALTSVVMTVNHTAINLTIVSPTNGYLTKVNSVIVNYTLNGSARNKVFALVEGANTLSIDTVDDLGHTVSASVNVTLDDIPPVVKIPSPLSGATTTLTSIPVTWLVDGVVQSTQTTENLVMGVNTITRTSTDATGNVGTSSITVTRVKTNSIPVGVNDAYTVNAGDSLKVVAPGVLANDTDADSDPLTVLLASGFKQGTFTLYASGALSYKPTLGFYGKDTLSYKVTDGKDTSALTNVVLTVTHTPINIVITSNIDGLVTKVSPIGVNYTINGKSQSKQFSLVQGTNLLTIDTVDDLGNTISSSVQVIFDNIAPMVKITKPSNGSVVNTPNFTVEYSVDGLSGYNEDFSLSEGKNNLKVQFSDEAGNWGFDSVSVWLDNQAPAIVIISPADGVKVSSTPIQINYTVDGVLFSKNYDLVEGLNHLVVAVTDTAGNTGTTELNVDLDTMGPSVAIFSPANGSVSEDLEVKSQILIADKESLIDRKSLKILMDDSDYSEKFTFNSDTLTADFSLAKGLHKLSVSARDALGNSSFVSSNFEVKVHNPSLVITSPQNFGTVRTADIVVHGYVNTPLSEILVGGIKATVSGNQFEAVVPLQDGLNTLIASGFNSLGKMEVATLTMTLDREKPRIYFASPDESIKVTNSTINVSGAVSDRITDVQSQVMPMVTVNGVQAKVENYTFSASVNLSIGINTITAVATDKAGNSESAVLKLERLAPTDSMIEMVSGDGQSAPVLSQLALPLKVAFKNLGGTGTLVSNKKVIFKVNEGDGIFENGSRITTKFTNELGIAEIKFILGKRSGPGANHIIVTSPSASNEILFSVVGVPSSNWRINTASGDMQRGILGSPAPKPLIAIVTDEKSNPIENAPVRFVVKKGGGHFDGNTSVVVNTGANGKAVASFTLGMETGRDNNLVEASVDDHEIGIPCTFVLSGYNPGPLADTKITGIILDNSNRPIPGVTVRIEGSGQQTSTDSNGQFKILNAPVGTVHLFVDGSTSSIPGDWVTLMFEVNSISGMNNDIGMPLYLVARNNAEGKIASVSEDKTITLKDIPGFELKVKAGSAIFPPDMEDHTISVTEVHVDKIPMPPGEGMQPRLIVSIGPPQVKFDPPAQITYPNVDGLRPGEQTHFYSFDHDLGTYVSIGTGTVSEDGMTVTSDKGFGIVKGGWHCAGPANPTGSAETPTIDDKISFENLNTTTTAKFDKVSGEDRVMMWFYDSKAKPTREPTNVRLVLTGHPNLPCTAGEAFEIVVDGTNEVVSISKKEEVLNTLKIELKPIKLVEGESKLKIRYRGKSGKYSNWKVIRFVVIEPHFISTKNGSETPLFDDETASSKNIALIESEPKMPDISMRLLPTTFAIASEVHCKIEYHENRRNQPNASNDVLELPSTGADTHVAAQTKHSFRLIVGDDKNPENFRGGEVSYTVKIAGLSDYKINFKIRGENPTESVAENYIDTKNQRWFFKYQGRHESDQNPYYFNQFNSAHLAAPFPGKPNFGGDETGFGGFGIYQITNPRPTNRQIWNWKANVDEASKRITGFSTQASDHLNAQRVLASAAAKKVGQEAFSIPDLAVNTITFSDLTGSSYTFLDAVTLKLYNGNSTPSNKGCKDYVCWVDIPTFDTPGYPGGWIFNPLNHLDFDYVDRVTKVIPAGVTP